VVAEKKMKKWFICYYDTWKNFNLFYCHWV
jgi:hypothetical protein